MSQLTDTLQASLDLLLASGQEIPAINVRNWGGQIIGAIAILEARARGNQIFYTSGKPGNSLGLEGDLGVNKDSGDFYHYTAGQFVFLFSGAGKAGVFTPIAQNAFGTHPAFTSQDVLNKYLLAAAGSGVAPAPAPTVTSFLPIQGAQGSTVVLTGTNFTGATLVSINSAAVASFVVDSATQLTAVLSSSQSTGKVRVTTPAGTGVSAGNFTVVGAAAVATPTNFVAAQLNATSIIYTWANAAGATQVVELSATSNFATIAASYTGTASVATISGLTVSTPYYARIKSQLAGLVDSAYATRNDSTKALLNLNVIGEGDSITAGPTQGSGDDPTHAPIVYAAGRIVSPAVSYVKLGNPSRTTRWFLDNQKAAVLSAVVSGKRNMLYHAYGANDIPLRSVSDRQADLLEFANWAIAQGTAFDGVLFIPVMNRLDTGSGGYGYSLENDGSHTDFNAARLALNAYVLNTILPLSPKFQQAPTTTSAMFVDTAPNDTTLFTSDQVHPTIAGSQDLGEQVIAPGLALFGDIALATINKAYQFNGASQNLTVANQADFKFETGGAFSVAFWATLTGADSVFTFGSADGTNRCWDCNLFVGNSTQVFFQLALVNGTQYTFSENSLSTLGRHRFVATYDGAGGVKLYVDGVYGGSPQNSGGYVGMRQGGTFRIGASASGVPQSKNAAIDTLAIVNRELTQAEVTQDYNNGNRTTMSGASFIGSVIDAWEFNNNLLSLTGNHNLTIASGSPIYV